MTNNDPPDDDQMLFRNVMRTVKPLKLSAKIVSHSATPKNVSVRSRVVMEDDLQLKPNQHHYSISEHPSDPVNTHTVLSYCSQTIPKKRLLQLKNGEIPCDARFDLHGLRLETACDRLVDFIVQQSNLGHRCVLIIHGKGSQHGEIPILKNQVNQLLQQLPHVLAFHSALNRQGGTGAVYVLLKRQRD